MNQSQLLKRLLKLSDNHKRHQNLSGSQTLRLLTALNAARGNSVAWHDYAQGMLEQIESEIKKETGKAETGNLINTSQNSDYSKPMPKIDMMKALKIDGFSKFNSFAKRHGIKKINRKLWQLRLNDLSSREREKLEKA
jgi:hypothetical protein